MRFENGAQGIVDNFFNIPDNSSKNRLEIYGSRGSILAEGTIGQSAYGEMIAYLEKGEKGYDAKQKRSNATSEKIEVQPVNMSKGEIEEFSECIEEDLEPTPARHSQLAENAGELLVESVCQQLFYLHIS